MFSKWPFDFIQVCKTISRGWTVKLCPRTNKAKLKTKMSSSTNTVNWAKAALHSLYWSSFMKTTFRRPSRKPVTRLQIIITPPKTSAEPKGNFSTVRRIKTFTMNTMGQQMLNGPARLSIENEGICGLLDGNSKVMEKCAHTKNNSFLFKKWTSSVSQMKFILQMAYWLTLIGSVPFTACFFALLFFFVLLHGGKTHTYFIFV